MEVFFVEIIQKRGRTSFKKIKRDARADVKQGTKTNNRGRCSAIFQKRNKNGRHPIKEVFIFN